MWNEPITRYTLGVSAMFSLYWLCLRFVVSPLHAKRKLPKESQQLLSTALLYLPGLVLVWLFIKGSAGVPGFSARFCGGGLCSGVCGAVFCPCADGVVFHA